MKDRLVLDIISGSEGDGDLCNEEMADSIIVFTLNEKCESYHYGGYKSVSFTDVKLTRALRDSVCCEGEGGYLVFIGEMHAENFAFSLDEIELELGFRDVEGYSPERTAFEKELSQTFYAMLSGKNKGCPKNHSFGGRKMRRMGMKRKRLPIKRQKTSEGQNRMFLGGGDVNIFCRNFFPSNV